MQLISRKKNTVHAELDKAKLEELGECPRCPSEPPPLYVKETNGNASKVAQLKTLLRDLFREVIVQSIIDVQTEIVRASSYACNSGARRLYAGLILTPAAASTGNPSTNR